MRKLLLIALTCVGVASLTGCGGWTYGGEDTFGKQGPHYGETPGYFYEPQPGLGGRAGDVDRY